MQALEALKRALDGYYRRKYTDTSLRERIAKMMQTEMIELIIQERLSEYFKKNNGPGMARLQRSNEFLVLLEEKAPELAEEFNIYLDWIAAYGGEAAALTWNDIDYKQNVIHVTKTVTFNEDNTRTTGTPKSESGKRDIPLNDTIKGILAKQRKKQSIIISIDKAENRVFVSVYGKMVDNCAVNRAISSALFRLEEQGRQMEHFTAHALRDTFATRYIEQGEIRRH